MHLFHQFFEATAARHPARTALRYGGVAVRYEELAARAELIAAGLASCGVRRGDRVVVHLLNRPEVVETALACSRLGAVFVPANAMFKLRQLSHIVRDSGARVVIKSLTSAPSLAELFVQCPELELVVVCDSSGDVRPTPERRLPYQALLSRGVGSESCAIDRDPFAILYTSGSTGRPKGVVVSHRNVVSGATCVASYLCNTAEDRLFAALPLSFDYGFSQVSTAFAVGACAVLGNFSTAPALLQELGSESITGLAGVPTMWSHLAETEWPTRAAQTLRYITNSGGALPAPVVRKLQGRLPTTRIYCMYGLTEAFRSTYLDPALLGERPGSIGKAVPNQEVLVMRQDGSPCAPGEVGELVHRGSFVTLGYWNDPDLTRTRFRPLPQTPAGLTDEIAVWSGDRVRTDADGFLYFVGRTDDLIKTSGHRVSPTEIEEVLAEAPGVIEAIAVGLPDDVLGQRIAAALVVDPARTETVGEAVRLHARMHLPAYMAPAEIRVFESLPRNANGKVDRAAVRASMQEAGE